MPKFYSLYIYIYIYIYKYIYICCTAFLCLNLVSRFFNVSIIICCYYAGLINTLVVIYYI